MTKPASSPSADRPLVFDCAGCSPGGRLAADLAWELHSRGVAELSWVVGIRQKVPVMLREARRRDTWVIDGCAAACTRKLFRSNRVHVTRYVRVMDTANRKASTTHVNVKALADQLTAPARRRAEGRTPRSR